MRRRYLQAVKEREQREKKKLEEALKADKVVGSL